MLWGKVGDGPAAQVWVCDLLANGGVGVGLAECMYFGHLGAPEGVGAGWLHRKR